MCLLIGMSQRKIIDEFFHNLFNELTKYFILFQNNIKKKIDYTYKKIDRLNRSTLKRLPF